MCDSMSFTGGVAHVLDRGWSLIADLCYDLCEVSDKIEQPAAANVRIRRQR